jgi:hypothetical protein
MGNWQTRASGRRQGSATPINSGLELGSIFHKAMDFTVRFQPFLLEFYQNESSVRMHHNVSD